MANALYGKGRQAFLDGDIDWSGDDIRVILVDTATYTVDIDVDEFHSDVTAVEIIATSGDMTGKTSTLGVADADDVTFPTVTGDQSEALIIYKWTGVSATSRLIAYMDTATGLPVTPNGTDVVITWSDGANKIFKQ